MSKIMFNWCISTHSDQMQVYLQGLVSCRNNEKIKSYKIVCQEIKVAAHMWAFAIILIMMGFGLFKEGICWSSRKCTIKSGFTMSFF